MAMTPNPAKALAADPNVTPLIDVLLVLLIIFMVIVPIAPKGLAVLVPQPPKHTQPVDNPIVLEVLKTPAGPTYRINGTTIEGKSRLAVRLNQINSTRADKVLFVQGDPGLSFASIADVLDISHAAGVDHVAIVTPAALR
ncbi:MAG: biopolymer transporter ExbD [Acidobacteriaceae bacterium]